MPNYNIRSQTKYTSLLISLTLAIVMIAVKTEKDVMSIILISIGAFLGTFVLDLDFLIYTYFIAPKDDFSQTLAGYIRHADFKNALTFIGTHTETVKEKTLSSFLFQLALAAITVFTVASNASYLVKALVISSLANSIYRMALHYFEGKSEEWFWALKNKPDKTGVVLYGVAFLGVIIYCFTII